MLLGYHSDMGSGKDLHSALQVQEITSAYWEGMEAKLMRLQSGKTDSWLSLHLAPNTYNIGGGIQTTDFLTYLGFERTACSFLPLDGYCRQVNNDFDLSGFKDAFSKAFAEIEGCERSLRACGINIPQPEGTAYFDSRSSRGYRKPSFPKTMGDGHTAPQKKRFDESEDKDFSYVFTWIVSNDDKGWVIHSRLKDELPSNELLPALKYLAISTFNSCPEFDFEKCYWHFLPFGVGAHVDPFRADTVHGVFQSHSTNWSSGLMKLVSADKYMRPLGMGFLPVTSLVQQRAVQRPEPNQSGLGSKKELEMISPSPRHLKVFLCHGTEDKPAVRLLHQQLTTLGVDPWFDEVDLIPGQNWNLEIRKAVRKSDVFLVCLSPKSITKTGYVQKEIKQALDVADEKPEGTIFVIPVRLEKCDLPERLSSLHWVNMYDDNGMEKLMQALKLRAEECGVSLT